MNTCHVRLLRPAHSAAIHRTSHLQILLMVAVALLFVSGCGSADPRITIHGIVTLNGKPLASGQAIFIPDNPSRGASGAAIKDGIFTIKVYKGSNRVEINGQETEQRPMAPGAPPEAGIVSKSIIPPRYNEKSTLTFDVQSEKDRPTFELTNER